MGIFFKAIGAQSIYLSSHTIIRTKKHFLLNSSEYLRVRFQTSQIISENRFCFSTIYCKNSQSYLLVCKSSLKKVNGKPALGKYHIFIPDDNYSRMVQSDIMDPCMQMYIGE
jgi:hypothetical protein